MLDTACSLTGFLAALLRTNHLILCYLEVRCSFSSVSCKIAIYDDHLTAMFSSSFLFLVNNSKKALVLNSQYKGLGVFLDTGMHDKVAYVG